MISRLVGWLTLFTIGTDLFVMSPLLPELTRDLGADAATGGWAVTVFALAYLVGGPTFGALADRRGRTAVLGAALVVFALANLGTALAPSFAMLLVARAVAGLAASGITPSVYALVSAAAPDHVRGTWLAVVTSGLLIALTTGAPAGSLLAQALGWRGVFVVLTVAPLALLAAIWWSSRRRATAGTADTAGTAGTAGTEQVTTAAASAPEPSDAEPPPSTVDRVRAVSVTALWALAVYGLYTYLGTILTGNERFSPELLALALVCFGIGAVAGNLGGGRLADRWGGRPTSVASLIGLGVLEVVAGLLFGRDAPALLIVALGLVAFAAYPYFSAQQARIIARYPQTSGSLIAWNNSAMYAGILIGSGVGGSVLAAAGPGVLAAATGVVALVGAVVATRSIRPRRPAAVAPAA